MTFLSGGLLDDLQLLGAQVGAGDGAVPRAIQLEGGLHHPQPDAQRGLVVGQEVRVQEDVPPGLRAVAVRGVAVGLLARAGLAGEEPVEEQIGSIAGVKRIMGKAYDGYSMLMIEFFYDKDLNVASQEVRDAISAIRADLPVEMKEPIVNKFNDTDRPII